MSDSKSEKDFEKSCAWMNEKFGEEEGLRKRREAPVWSRRMNSRLLKAIRRGDSDQVNKWLHYGASVEAAYEHSGDTAVIVAASLEEDTILRKLLRAGASPNIKNKRGQEPIHVAVWHGRAAAVTALCAINSSVVNSSISRGDSAKSINPDACKGEEPFEYQIPMDLENGVTALHIASMRNFLVIVELLLEKGAELKVFSTKTSSTPLDVVGIHAEPPHNTEEAFLGVCSFLLENHRRLPNVEKPLHIGRCRKAQRFTTALHTAVKCNYLAAIDVLLDNGTGLGVWDKDGQTALHLTIKLQHMEPLLTILKWNNERHTLEVDVRNSSGLTALQYAASLGQVNYVMVLLEGGADTSVTGLAKSESFDRFSSRFEFVYPPEECGCRKCSADLHTDKGEKNKDRLIFPISCFAVMGKSVECLQILSTDVSDLLFTLENKMNLLHLAAWCNAPEITKFLIDKLKEYYVFNDMVNQICMGNIKGLNRFAMAPIHIASSHKDDSSEVIKCLVEEGKCDITLLAELKSSNKFHHHSESGSSEESTKNYRGQEPLHFAASAANKKNAEILFHYKGKSLSSREKCEQDQKMLVVPDITELANCEVLRQLLLHGADLSSIFRDGYQTHRLITMIEMYVEKDVSFLHSILDAHIENCTDKTDNPFCQLNYRILAPGGPQENQMKVLDAMVSFEEIKRKHSLLLHPLTESFIYLKWRRLKIFYNVYVFFQLLMTLLITALSCLEHVKEAQQYVPETSKNILKCALAFVTTFVIVTNPIPQTIRLNKYLVLPNFRSTYRITLFVLTAMMVFGNVHNSGRGVASLALLLSWIELLYLLSRYPWSDRFPLGSHFIMFIAVVSNFTKVAASFFLLFVAFALSFLVLLSDYEDDSDQSNPYKSPVRSFVKTITMLTDFDNEHLFKNDSYLLQTQSEHFVNVGALLGSLVYLGFFFLMCIAMTNFMTGVAIDDIKFLKKQGKARINFERVQTIKRLEIFSKHFGIDANVPLMKIVWLYDHGTMNDLPQELCLAVARKVRRMREKNKHEEDGK